MSTALKPCPECGGNNACLERWLDEVEGGSYKTFYRGMCRTCNHAIEPWEEDVEKAVGHWNTRPIEDALLARATAAEARAERLQAELDAANEDAARLAGIYHDDDGLCIYCGNRVDHHADNCEIKLHLTRVKGGAS